MTIEVHAAVSQPVQKVDRELLDEYSAGQSFRCAWISLIKCFNNHNNHHYQNNSSNNSNNNNNNNNNNNEFGGGSRMQC